MATRMVLSHPRLRLLLLLLAALLPVPAGAAWDVAGFLWRALGATPMESKGAAVEPRSGPRRLRADPDAATAAAAERREKEAARRAEAAARRAEASRDRGPLIQVLAEAGAAHLSLAQIKALPTWAQVASLYGSDPVVYGLETCGAYRARFAELHATNASGYDVPRPRVAGLFNTGTNALAESMNANFQELEEYKLYNLHWGKHVPPRHRWIDKYDPDGIDAVLPVVLIRDPLYWMQSMCKAPYNAFWDRGLNGRCPNLVPTPREREVQHQWNATYSLDVTVRTVYRDHYESLAGLWSEWNRLWLEYPRPRLMVRFEDFLFHGDAVMRTISECSGMPLHETLSYQLEPSKKHGHSSDLFGAIVKYGSGQGRIVNYTAEEKEYLRTALDPELMHLFRYKPLEAEGVVSM